MGFFTLKNIIDNYENAVRVRNSISLNQYRQEMYHKPTYHRVKVCDTSFDDFSERSTSRKSNGIISHIDNCDHCTNYHYEEREKTEAFWSSEITAESETLYNQDVFNADRKVQEAMNLMIEAYKEEEIRITKESRELDILEQNFKQEIDYGEKSFIEFKKEIMEQERLVNRHRIILDEKKLEEHILANNALLKKEELHFYEEVLRDLKEIIDLMKSRNLNQDAVIKRLGELLKNQSGLTSDLCLDLKSSDKEIYQGIESFAYDERAYLMLKSFVENDEAKDLVRLYVVNQGFDPNYLAYVKSEISTKDYLNYSSFADYEPISYKNIYQETDFLTKNHENLIDHHDGMFINYEQNYNNKLTEIDFINFPYFNT